MKINEEEVHVKYLNGSLARVVLRRGSHIIATITGLSWRLRPSRICLKCRRPRFDSWVQEDPLEEGMATHSSISNGKSHGQRGCWATAHGVLRVGQERLNHTIPLSTGLNEFLLITM